MKILTILLAGLLMLLPSVAIGSEKCIEIDGKLYCQAQQEVSIGGVQLTVKDPNALLRAAKETRGTLKKVGLYDDYHYLPVIVELANQNDMEYDEFITFMIENWGGDQKENPFFTIRSFEMVYDRIPPIYKHTVLTGIAYKLAHDVEMAIYESLGVEVSYA